MSDLTLKALAKRVEALERILTRQDRKPARKDWRKTIGMFGASAFMRAVDEQCRRSREQERAAARGEESPE